MQVLYTGSVYTPELLIAPQQKLSQGENYSQVFKTSVKERYPIFRQPS